MNYKDQILKEFANSGYDKKTYLGLVKKKTHHMRNVNYIDGTKHDNFDNQNNSKAESKIINIDKNKKNNSDDIFTEQVDPETGINVLDDNNDKIPETEKNKLIENKISEFENYLAEMALDIEIIQNNQKNIINAINKLSKEMTITKNKIIE